jgi:UDP-GlcNAc:undecaprenyl-phosphate/decaprenyl-phosphate GlcNAc-1-phosphate transferase
MTLFFVVSFLGALVAGLTAGAAVPFVTRIAMAIRAMDYPGGRRLQGEAIPRMGGIAIASGIVVGASVSGLLLWRQFTATVGSHELVALLLGAVLIFLVGLVEDVIGLSAVQRFVVQGVAAGAVVYGGWSFGNLYVPFSGNIHLGLLGVLFTMVWIVGVTNAINLLDGLDGLAGGVTAIIASSLLIFAWVQGQFLTVILMSAIVGACLGFLRHNWAPAKIFMGDSGSLTLGFLLATMSLYSSIKGAATVAILVPILALGLPVIDTLLVMAVRFVEKPQGSTVRRFSRMFQADRNHLHHVMTRAAPGRKRIVLVIYLVAACFCAMALLVAVSRSASLGVALVFIEVAVVLFMRNLKLRPKTRDLSLNQRRQVREALMRRA